MESILTAHPTADSMRRAETAEESAETLLALILASLDDDKAEDVTEIDLRGKTAIADYMVVASGRSARHVITCAEKLVERLKQSGMAPPKVEGAEYGDWVLIDAGDVIAHLFRPEVRAFYDIERMWAAPGGQAKPA